MEKGPVAGFCKGELRHEAVPQYRRRGIYGCLGRRQSPEARVWATRLYQNTSESKGTSSNLDELGGLASAGNLGALEKISKSSDGPARARVLVEIIVTQQMRKLPAEQKMPF